MNKKYIIGGLVIILGSLTYLTFTSLPGDTLDSKVLYRSVDYGFELEHPLALQLDFESPDLKTGIDEYNLSKVRFGNIELSVLKRKNRDNASCLREDDLKVFTDCLLQGPRYDNKKTYEKKLGDNNFLFQEYDILNGQVWQSFLDAFIANQDRIFQFSMGVTDKNDAKRRELENILKSFKFVNNQPTSSGSTANQISQENTINKNFKCPDANSPSGLQWQPNSGNITFNCVIDDQRTLIFKTKPEGTSDSARGPFKNYSIILTNESEPINLQQIILGTGPVYDNAGKGLYYDVKVRGDLVDVTYTSSGDPADTNGWRANTKKSSVIPYISSDNQ